MSEESNTVLGLRNAWSGAVAASEKVRELDSSVQALSGDLTLDDLDLEVYHSATLAQSNAVMALRGVVEQLRRKKERGADAG